MIVVTFALPAESSGFVRLLEDRATTGRGAEAVIGGTLHGHHVRILHTGVGAEIARARLAALLPKMRSGLLISSGFAGAVADGLEPAELILAENYSAPDLFRQAQIALAGRALHVGKLATANAVIDSLVERRLHADASGAIAVDMETQSIADICAQLGIPLLSLRAISDTPAWPFPAPADVLFDIERQRTDAARLALYLATHPAAIGRLIAFSKQIASAREALTHSLDLLLRSLPAKSNFP